ncbi:hypothetical protein CCMSSC00406_0001669 [Pleurotus cornucopiae]|uniref:Uncharacterized protein n=1 Tax=Pleurotus cornucopiae TaxID=5321 RepID=A0ACB7IND7_PLECO|nr:hypothetical protein CCMSSC00406_0001669 [Pleurotus cornucopiae]
MASTLYISNAVNRYSHAADISSTSHVAFGSTKVVSFWDTSTGGDLGVGRTLPGHDGVITVVRFLNDSSVVTGDNKGVLRVWQKSTDETTAQA